ncbi:Uma2 family endonuclease [Endothiovibrio diazotrophicus]
MGSVAYSQLHHFTVHDFHKMAESGILDGDSRVELIEGEVLEMVPIGSPHVSMVNRLTSLFAACVAGCGRVSVQNPLGLSELSEPRPDLVVLRPREDDYEAALPTPADAYLVVEVFSRSLAFDRHTKLPLYGASGVPEVWIVDLSARRVECHSGLKDGSYGECRVVEDGEFSPRQLPDCLLSHGDLFR